MREPHFTKSADHSRYTASAPCLFCSKMVTATIQPAELFTLRQGAFVQDAFPNLTPEQREVLFISGVCSPCMDDLLPDESEY